MANNSYGKQRKNTGSSSNGWVDWKNDKGETLDALKRGNMNNHGGTTE
jgi:hypothetical protein